MLAAVALGAGFWQQQREAGRQRIDSYWSGALSARDADDDALRAAHYLARAADLGGAGAARDNALIAIGMLAGGVELAGEIALPAAPDGLRAAADARLLLAWRGREAWLHALGDGRLLARLEHPDAVAEGLVLADGAVVTRDAGGGVWLWGGAAAPRALAEGGVARIAVDREGRQLVGWGDDGLRRWTLPEAAPAVHLLAGSALAGVAFAERGRLLAWDAAGRFWRVDETGATAWETGCAPRGVALAADGRGAISFCDTALIRHDPAAGRVAARWSSPESIDGVRFDADAGLVVSWSAGRGRVRVWQAADGAPRFERPLDREGSLSRVLLLPGGARMLTAGADGRLEAWNLAQGELAARGRHHREEAPVLAEVDAEGTRLLAWSRAAGARLWDAGTLTPLSLPLRHAGSLVGASLVDGGAAILSWADDGSVRLWRRRPAHELTAPAAPGTEPLLPRPQPPDAALQARLDRLGLHGYQVLDAEGEQVLLAAGPLVRRLGPGERLSPPLALDEGARGGVLLGEERVVLWGNSSVRLWDAAAGRPLSALLRSDVLFPQRGAVDGGLLVSDGLQARRWRWSLPTTAGAAAWLALDNATAMDEHGAIRPLTGAEWCARMRAARRAAIGCDG